MKHLKTFEGYNTELVNEGIIDIIQKNTGKLKNYIKSKIESLAPGKLEQIKRELEEFKGMSFNDIRKKVNDAVVASEGKVNEYSEPRSDNYGRPSVSSYASNLTISDVIDKILGGTMLGAFLIGVANWFVMDVLGKGQLLSDKFLGFTVLSFFVALLIYVFKGMMESD